jgi:uncharacterized protein YbjT (DUF2867 family)
VAGTVLVLGAGGFLGGHVAAALQGAGWRVLRGVRSPRAADERRADVATMTTPADWHAALAGVDAVVNLAGILREQGRQRFATVHHEGPLALAQACVALGVRRFVQVSALGREEDGEFVASKHRFDRALLELPLEAVVLRPSVVYSTAGSYGGTSLLRALAALPGVLPLPGHGRWRVQPLAAEDLAELVRRALASDVRGLFEVGGPEVLELQDYQRAWRRWLSLPPARVLRAPAALVSFVVAAGEALGRGPLGATTWRMLRRGNVTAADAHARLQAGFGHAPRALAEVLAARPSQVQDRWHAPLYLLGPLLRAGVIALFLLSAWVGFATPAAEIAQLAAGSLLADAAPVPLARVAAALDLGLGLALLAGWRTRAALAAMLALVAAYTLAFGLLLPAAWLDPLGGLAKNLVVLPALAVLWVLAERR